MGFGGCRIRSHPILRHRSARRGHVRFGGHVALAEAFRVDDVVVLRSARAPLHCVVVVTRIDPVVPHRSVPAAERVLGEAAVAVRHAAIEHLAVDRIADEAVLLAREAWVFAGAGGALGLLLLSFFRRFRRFRVLVALLFTAVDVVLVVRRFRLLGFLGLLRLLRFRFQWSLLVGRFRSAEVFGHLVHVGRFSGHWSRRGVLLILISVDLVVSAATLGSFRLVRMNADALDAGVNRSGATTELVRGQLAVFLNASVKGVTVVWVRGETFLLALESGRGSC